MKEPSSILPFWIEYSTAQIADAYGGVVTNSDSKEDLRDAEYIVQACNEFPIMVELLKEAYDELVFQTSYDNTMAQEIKKFLINLENETTT